MSGALAMQKVEPTLRCPCGETARRETFRYDAPPQGETRFDLSGGDYRRAYEACTICGHWFARHDIDLSALYRGGYVDATYGGAAGMRRRLEAILALPPEKSDNAARVACVSAFAERRFGGAAGGRRLLDVGAGIGVFPAAMKALGWSVTGIEPDARTAAHLREVVGIAAIAEDIEALSPVRIGRFDVITFNKVLEHIEDPVGPLAQARGLLSENGFVYIELPDIAAAADGPGREEFFIEHHHVFSPASLALMAERAGFSPAAVERVREPSGKFTVRGFLVAG